MARNHTGEMGSRKIVGGDLFPEEKGLEEAIQNSPKNGGYPNRSLIATFVHGL